MDWVDVNGLDAADVLKIEFRKAILSPFGRPLFNFQQLMGHFLELPVPAMPAESD